MIIGKSLTALGGGGLKPEIVVTAKAGALLKLHFKGSSVILQSYQLGISETTHIFIVDVSNTAYVIDDATNSTSIEVLVDMTARYEVEIKYRYYLYYYGNEYESITGGWSQGTGSNGNGSITKNSNNITIYVSADSNTVRGIATNNAISISGYRKVGMIADITVDGTENGCFGGWGLTPVRSWAWDGDAPSGILGGPGFYGYNMPAGSVKTGTDVLLEFDINGTGNYYPYIENATGSGAARTVVLKQFWFQY